MKTTRRILSMVLALMMILSLSVTAFATGADPIVNVNIKSCDGEVVASHTLKGAVDDTLMSVVDGSGTAQWKEVQDYYEPTETRYALTSLYEKGSQAVDTDNAAEMAIVRAALLAEGYTDEQIDKIGWLTGENAAYGLIGTSTSGDETTYTYVYAGYDWSYSSNQTGDIWDYMCCYLLSENETVTLTYSFSAFSFPRTTPIV